MTITNRQEDHLDFGAALLGLRNGLKVARTGWNAGGMWICFFPGFVRAQEDVYAEPIRQEIGDGVGCFRPYLMMKTAQGDFVPWVASQTDLLADDWHIVP